MVSEITREFKHFIPIGEMGYETDKNVYIQFQSLDGKFHIEQVRTDRIIDLI
jgi:hypothetical protein